MSEQELKRPKPQDWMWKAAEEICAQPSCPEGIEADEANFAYIISKHCPDALTRPSVAAGQDVGAARLTFADLRETNLVRCARWHKGGVQDWSLSDWAVATAGELGEACNVVKKLNRERDGLVGNDKSLDDLRAQLADEIADTAIYLDLMAAREGIDLDAAIISKYNRTSEKNGFPDRLPPVNAATLSGRASGGEK